MNAPAKRIEILPARRQAMILEHLRTHGATAIGELASTLGGSQSTIRRDLEHLTRNGYLERTHGGAVLVPATLATFEREPSITAQLRHAQKVVIGIAAAAMLDPGESVIFEASTTVFEAARAASQRGIPLTTITNSLDIGLVCSTVREWRVIIPGGTLRPGSRSLVGDLADGFFRTVHADLCFIGTGAITGTTLTDTSFEISALKRAMIRSSRRTILLADSSKFTTPSFCTFGDLSMIDEIITDDEVDAEVLAALRSHQTEVRVLGTSLVSGMREIDVVMTENGR